MVLHPESDFFIVSCGWYIKNKTLPYSVVWSSFRTLPGSSVVAVKAVALDRMCSGFPRHWPHPSCLHVSGVPSLVLAAGHGNLSVNLLLVAMRAEPTA